MARLWVGAVSGWRYLLGCQALLWGKGIKGASDGDDDVPETLTGVIHVINCARNQL